MTTERFMPRKGMKRFAETLKNDYNVSAIMKPKILVTREIFDDVIDYLKQHFDVTANQADTPMDAEALAQNLAGKAGAMTTLVDRVDAQLLARCPELKAVCNIAVGFNNIDLAACTQAGSWQRTRPGCWTTARRTSPGR